MITYFCPSVYQWFSYQIVSFLYSSIAISGYSLFGIKHPTFCGYNDFIALCFLSSRKKFVLSTFSVLFLIHFLPKSFLIIFSIPSNFLSSAKSVANNCHYALLPCPLGEIFDSLYPLVLNTQSSLCGLNIPKTKSLYKATVTCIFIKLNNRWRWHFIWTVLKYILTK